jgi:malate dehydrogenase
MKELGDVVLFDIAEGIPQGKALDIAQSSPVEGFDAKLSGANDYAGIEGADVVHRHRRRAAQARHEPRRPSRHQPEGHGAGRRRHQAICAERLRHLHHQPARRDGLGAAEVLGLPKQVVGMAGVLDSARFRYFLAEEFKRLGRGRHGLRARRPRRHMVPLVRYSTVAGIPLPDLVKMGWTTQEKLDKIVQRTRDGGAEIVEPAEDRLGLLRAGRLGDRDGRELPQGQEARAALRRHLNGQYGVKDIYVGVPVVIGAGGVERIVEIDLSTPTERRCSTSRSPPCRA